MKKILWIDDDYIILESLLDPAKRAGFTVDTFQSLDEVGNFTTEQLSQYSLAIIDLSLPSKSESILDNEGLELINSIRNVHRISMPIIVLSGYVELIMDIEKEDFYNVITIVKPIRPSALLNEILKIEAENV
jgi:DNA-binding response OmpR family regulator